MTISKAVGIDLGNIFAGVAVWKDDQATMIINNQGKRRTSSVVAFTKSTRLVGDEATTQMIENPKGTIYDLKRMTGCHYYDFQVQDGIETWPFMVTDINGEPMVKINVKHRKQQLLSMEELSAMVLQYLKRTAEEHIKTSVEDCVIAVPVYFNYQQQQATQKAAKIAGFKNIQLINEPVAAVLAFSMDTTKADKYKGNTDNFHHALVVDLGGDYLQVTILNMEHELVKVKAANNNMHLGGKVMTAAIVDDVASKIKETRAIDVSSTMNWSMRRRLQVACERVKRKLSFVPHTNLALDNFFGNGDHLKMVISRDRFEEINDAVFTAFMDHVEQTLVDAQLDKVDMEDILLVGGGAHIPMIRQLVTELFGQAPNVAAVRPEEAVALGAAIQAAVLKGDTNGDQSDTRWTLDEFAPLSLGAEVGDGVMDVFIMRGASLPVHYINRYTLCNHKQKVFTLNIYQGERKLASQNTLLGTLKLDGHWLSRRGEGQVQVEFFLNNTGCLTVKAKCLQNGWATKEIRIKIARRTKKNIKRMVDQGNRFAQWDKEFAMKVEAKHALETLAYGYLYSLSDADGTKAPIDLLARNTLDWINECSHGATMEDYKKQHQNLLDSVNTIKNSTWSVAMDPVGGNSYWCDGLGDYDEHTLGDVLVSENEDSGSEDILNVGSIIKDGSVEEGVSVVQWDDFLSTYLE